jgi:transposase
MRQTPTSSQVPDLDQLRAWLGSMVKSLRFVDLIIAVVALVAKMRGLNLQLTKRIAHLTRKRPRSETLERLERQLVLPLSGLTAERREPPTDLENNSKKRRRSPLAGGRNPFAAHLPRVPIPHRVAAELRLCPICGLEMKPVAPSIQERLTFDPAKIKVEQHVCETLACPTHDTIVSAPAPAAIVERGMLSDTLIVEATCDKYLDHLPIERQCQRYQRAGAPIAPQTLGRSVTAHIDLLEPIAKLIHEQTRAPGLLATDATSIPILDPSTPEGIRLGTMWCWTNASWVTFFYCPKADSNGVRRFLGDDLCRNVQCDGTNVTSFIERAGGQRPGCWSHGRRRFVEAARGGDAIALEGVQIISPIFAIERQSKLAGDTADERRARRQAQTRPLLDELRQWLDEHRAETPPKTPLGRALGYLHRQWHRLLLFLEDGNIEATNNRRERELRRLVLGRKNWLFTWLDVGGERTAAVLTIVATCIAHDVNPRAYLHLVTKLIVNGWPNAQLRDLLPDRVLRSHPELYVGEHELGALGGVAEPLLPATT